ncbi:MAG: efflux RND transporter periplasmic adaptor subunit [Gammaproteobacteria bacterium]
MAQSKFSLAKMVAVVVLLAIIAGAYSWWNTKRALPAEKRYVTEVVSYGDVAMTVTANGTINPVVLVNVGTQVSGTVKKLYADFNGQVTAGQKLLELDPSIYEAAVGQSRASVANAEASLKLAQANEKRTRELYGQEYVSRQELDQSVQARESAQAQLHLAQAQLRRDRTNLGYTIIRSPVSGVVVSRVVDLGQTVAASFQTPVLFTIAQDVRQMQIDTNVAEADVGNVRVGQLVRFNVDAFPNRSFQGTVKQIRLNPITVQNVVTYDVVVGVENPDKTLFPGMTAYINIVVTQRNNVPLIPNAAMRFKPKEEQQPAGKVTPARKKREPGSATVYVLKEGQLKPVKVRIGITDNKYTEVLGGDLKPGDKVVTDDLNEQAGGGAGSAQSFRVRMF